MNAEAEVERLRREAGSWWPIERRRLLRDAALNAIAGKREARILELGCKAQLAFTHPSTFRVVNVNDSLAALVFPPDRPPDGDRLCTRYEELALASNSIDTILAGDVLQLVSDDLAVLRELRRVLKDGGSLCLTVPAYPFLWGEEDEARGHRRRYTASEMRQKLNNCGFELARVSYFVACGFGPAVLERVGKSIFKKSLVPQKMASDLPEWANQAMVLLLECERHLIRFINFPFGTRLVCWARKPALVTERIVVPAWDRQWATNPLPQGMS